VKGLALVKGLASVWVKGLVKAKVKAKVKGLA
jgi:hypothetical protein